MALWNIGLKWDGLTVCQAMLKKLEDEGFLNWENKKLSMVYGMADSGESAFILYGRLGDYIIRVYVENEAEQIRIAQGHIEAPKPERKSKFSSKNQLAASEFFEECVKACCEVD